MKTSEKILRPLWAAVVVLGLLGARSQAQYVFTTIDDPVALANSGTTYVMGISGNIVVGYYFGPVLHGFYHTLGTTNYTTLDEPLGYANGSSSTQAFGISGNNIVGVYQDYANGAAGYYGFIYNIATSNYTTLEDLASVAQDTSRTYPHGIDGTNIVGYITATPSIYVTYNGGFLVTTGSGGNNYGAPFYYPSPDEVRNEGSYDLTNYNTVVFGISGPNVAGYWTDEDGVYHGIIYNLNTLNYTALNSPTNSGCPLTGIDGNNVVGYYADPNHGYNYSGFIYNMASSNYISSLRDPLAPGNTFLEGISGGAIVGYYIDNSGNAHGFAAAIPVPVLNLKDVGNSLVFTASNGVAGATCFIVDSTDLSLPLSEWLVLSSNVFKTNGVFTYTNAITPGMPATYYGLQEVP